MKKTILLAVGLIFTGCFGNGYQTHNYGSYQKQNSTISTQSTSSTLPAPLKNSIKYMYEEERLAHDVYLAIYQKQPVMQLERIATRSETRHINAVKELARKYNIPTYSQRMGVYNIPHIQSLYNTLYQKGIKSQKDALEVGCIVEVTDIDDLDKYIYQAQKYGKSDIVNVFEFLRRGSYNHYHAFDRGLKQLGISNGCCSLGSKYCHPEYPSNHQGGGMGRGRHGGGRWGYGGGRMGGGGIW